LALTALDIIVLLAVASGAVLGGMRGFVTEATSLLAWIVAILAVRLFHPLVSEGLAGPVGTSAGAAVLAFALVFGVTFLGVRLLGRSLGKKTKASMLGPVDRLLGFGFGAIKGLIIVTLGFLFVSLIYDTIYGRSAERPAWMTESRTFPLVRASAEAISDLVEQGRAR
jgi:membrane protein required for colicin V production